MSKAKSRTKAQKLAAIRDGQYCLWHFYRLMQLVPLTEEHHIFGRSRWDTVETCIGLCHECHIEGYHNSNNPSKNELVALMVELYGYDYAALGITWKGC